VKIQFFGDDNLAAQELLVVQGAWGSMDGDEPQHLADGVESRKIEKRAEKAVHLTPMLDSQWLQFSRQGRKIVEGRRED